MGAVAEKAAPSAVPPPVSTPTRCKSQPMEIGHKRRFLIVKAGPGHTVDDIRHPAYFGIHANRFGRHDIVIVLLDDETQEIELCVERVTQNEVYCSVRKVYQREGLGDGSTQLAPNFRTKRVPGKDWCVERVNDGALVITGHQQEANAIAQWRREQPRVV